MRHVRQKVSTHKEKPPSAHPHAEEGFLGRKWKTVLLATHHHH
jgi:hypothetical protein